MEQLKPEVAIEELEMTDRDDLEDALDESEELQLGEESLDEEESDGPQPGRRGRGPQGKRGRTRAKTIAMKRLSKEELRLGALLYPPTDHERPTEREDCQGGMRPCPFVSCKHHLYLDVNPETGSIKLNFPDLEVWEMEHTCALDVADRGGVTLEEVGEILNLTRERIRQVEVRGLLKLKMASPVEELETLAED